MTAYDMVVDGGGTKTAVTLRCIDDGPDMHFKGLTGSSNVFTCSTKTVVNAIKSAFEKALNLRYSERSCCERQTIPRIDQIVLRNAYVGLAGAITVDEEKLQEVEAQIIKLFKQVKQLKVMSDLLLLPISLPLNTRTKNCIAVIAGTGSSALCYEAVGNEFRFLAKSGGWGPQFGDDGGGYSIGKEAIRSTLRAIDENDILSNSELKEALKSIHQRVYAAITNDSNVKQHILLQELNNLLQAEDIGASRQKIAGLTKIVFEELESTNGSAQDAHKIISKEAKAICQYIAPFEKIVDFEQTTLVLSGTLFSLDYYYDTFCRQLAQIPLVFDSIEIVSDPATKIINRLAHS